MANTPKTPGFQDRLRWLLQHRGRSMQSLSREVGLSDGAVKQMLTNRAQSPRGENLQNIAAALGVRADWLTGAWTPLEDAAVDAILDTHNDEVLRLAKTARERLLDAGEAVSIEEWAPVWVSELTTATMFEDALKENRVKPRVSGSRDGDPDPAPPSNGVPFAHNDDGRRPGRDIPVYASAAAADDAQMVSFEPVDWIARPPGLENVARAYGVYVVNDSMEPKYRQGAILFIDPARPPRRGDIVFVVLINSQDNEHRALVKELISTSPQGTELRQYNPPRDISLPGDQVHTIHRVAGNLEPG